VHMGTRQSGDPNWRRPILFDSVVRERLVFKSRKGRETAAWVSDLLSYGSLAHVVVDNSMVQLLRKNPDVAWQMMVINVQAYGVAMVLNVGSKRLFRRERPFVERCDADPDYSRRCGSRDQTASFFSGHSTFTATGAGLICAHHTQLQLYKDPLFDAATCVFAVGMTAATGVLRMTSDNHWSTDVLVGHLVGYAAGYLMPTLLYYKEFRLMPRSEPRKDQARMLLLPTLDAGGIQLSLIGLM
jgi:hypothetical protein